MRRHPHILAASVFAALVPAAGAEVDIQVTKTAVVVRQLSHDGNISVGTALPFGEVRVFEGLDLHLLPPRPNIVVHMDGALTTQLQIDLDVPLGGRLTLELGEASRIVSFVGSSNAIGGDLRIDAGSGGQSVDLADMAALVVAGRLRIDLGEGLDFVQHSGGDVVVSKDADLRGVNSFVNPSLVSIGGNLRFDVAKDTRECEFANAGTMLLHRNLILRGGPFTDVVLLSNEAFVGNVDVDLGAQEDGPDQQRFSLNDSRVFGNVRLRSGAGAAGATFESTMGTQVHGNVDVALGPGHNSVSMYGDWPARKVRYRGGAAGESVQAELNAPAAKCTFKLGGGVDVFLLLAGTNVKALTIDFGPDVDSFVDSIGEPYPFPVTTKNLP